MGNGPVVAIINIAISFTQGKSFDIAFLFCYFLKKIFLIAKIR